MGGYCAASCVTEGHFSCPDLALLLTTNAGLRSMKASAVSRSSLETSAVPISFPEKALLWDSQGCAIIRPCLVAPRVKWPRWGEVDAPANFSPPDLEQDMKWSPTPGSNSSPGQVTHLCLPADWTTAWLTLGQAAILEAMISPTGLVLVTPARQTCAQHLQMALLHGSDNRGSKLSWSHPKVNG